MPQITLWWPNEENEPERVLRDYTETSVESENIQTSIRWWCPFRVPCCQSDSKVQSTFMLMEHSKMQFQCLLIPAAVVAKNIVISTMFSWVCSALCCSLAFCENWALLQKKTLYHCIKKDYYTNKNQFFHLENFYHDFGLVLNQKFPISSWIPPPSSLKSFRLEFASTLL